MKNEKEIVKVYIADFYDTDLKLMNHENQNHVYDVLAHDRSLLFTIEYKTRDFITDTNDRFLHEDDILVELIQSLPYFCENSIPINNTVNDLYDPHKINIAVGWFYKCFANRLIYIRRLDGQLYDLIDLAFNSLFKPWFLNHVHKFELQYSGKTTGTINAKVPIDYVPKVMRRWVKAEEFIKEEIPF